jgi:hypothetical protein
MPRPTSSTTLQRPDLGALLHEYFFDMAMTKFIADMVMPIFRTKEQSGDYPVIPTEALLKLPHDIKRAARGKFPRGDYQFETGQFATEEFGWEEPVDRREAKLYERYFDAEMMAGKRAANILLRSREKRVADFLFNESTFSSQVTTVDMEWSSAADADITGDAKAARQAVRDRIGVKPNGVILSYKVLENIVNSLQFQNNVKYTTATTLQDEAWQREAVRKFLGVDKLFVGDAVRDSAKKGQDSSLADIWSTEYVLFGLFATQPEDLSEPCIGRSFLWDNYLPDVMNTESYEEPQIDSTIIRVRHDLDDDRIVMKAAGQLLKNITA